MNTGSHCEITTPLNKLPTKGYSVVIGAPHGFPIRDNAAARIIATCISSQDAEFVCRACSCLKELQEKETK